MKKCSRCGKEYGDEMTFCAECGEKLEEKQVKFCRNCGEKLASDALVCPKCGAELVKNSEEKKKNNVFKKIVIACTTVAVAVVVVIGGVVIKTKTHPETVDAYYYKKNGNEWYYYNANTREHGQAGYNEKDVYYTDAIFSAPILNEDGSKVFYTEDKSLLYRNLKGKDNKEVLIDTNICEYAINADGSEVAYIKNNGSLYKYKLKKNKKEQLIDLNSKSRFIASEDLNKFLIVQPNEDDSTRYVFLYDVRNNRRNDLMENLGIPYAWNSDLSEMEFMDEGINALYVYSYKDGEITKGNTLKLMSNYEDGKRYYFKIEAASCMDFIDDDMSNDKISKAELRQELESYHFFNVSICYFDGNKEIVVAKNYISDISDIKVANNVPAVAVMATNIKYKSLKLSQIERSEDVLELLNDNAELTWIVKDKVKDTILDVDNNYSSFEISDDGKYIIYNGEKGVYLQSDKDERMLLPENASGSWIALMDSGAVLFLYGRFLRQYLDGNITDVCDGEVWQWESMKSGDILIIEHSDGNGILERYDGENKEYIDKNIRGIVSLKRNKVEDFSLYLIDKFCEHHRMIYDMY